jgi:hypothetical protein
MSRRRDQVGEHEDALGRRVVRKGQGRDERQRGCRERDADEAVAPTNDGGEQHAERCTEERELRESRRRYALAIDLERNIACPSERGDHRGRDRGSDTGQHASAN